MWMNVIGTHASMVAAVLTLPAPMFVSVYQAGRARTVAMVGIYNNKYVILSIYSCFYGVINTPWLYVCQCLPNRKGNDSVIVRTKSDDNFPIANLGKYTQNNFINHSSEKNQISFTWIFSYLYIADTNECLQNPCLNDGTCVNTDGSYECKCTSFWKGRICEMGKFVDSTIYSATKLLMPTEMDGWVFTLFLKLRKYVIQTIARIIFSIHVPYDRNNHGILRVCCICKFKKFVYSDCW